LPLEFDVFWPSNESGQISFWLEVLTNSKVFASFFEKWVIGLLFGNSFADWSGGRSFSFSDHFKNMSLFFLKAKSEKINLHHSY
jgi:hypothetical protein